ncbi:MAG: VWA domain-containing protein [Pseudomonadota bacterium]|nr:VWA domain-containing protein [Pseudomonadota bacterium]
MRPLFPAALCVVLLALPAIAQTPPVAQQKQRGKISAILVLDASGSMWGQVDGTPKMDIAKQVVAGMLGTWNPQDDLGLVVYGHRSKGECTDIETLLSPGPVTPDFLARVNAISPKGKTPLADSVKKAAEDLKYTENKATVILLTDGLETCNPDPCGVAKTLEKTGVDLTVHVIGFDVKDSETGQLRCMAESTGGLYLPAASAAQLQKALQTVVVRETPPAPAPTSVPKPVGEQKPAVPAVSLSLTPAQVPLSGAFSVSWTGQAGSGDFLQIIRPAAEGRAEQTLFSSDVLKTPPVTLKAPEWAGVYEVRYIHGATQAVAGRASLAVRQPEVTLAVPAAVVVAAPFQITWTGPGNAGDYVTIVKADAPVGTWLSYQETARGNPLTLMAPDQPGTWELRYSTAKGNILARQAITVAPVSATISAPAAVRAGEAFQVTWMGPNYKGDYVTIVKAGAPQKTWLSYQETSRGNPVTLKAPAQPGAYEVRYSLASGTVLVRVPVAVR